MAYFLALTSQTCSQKNTWEHIPKLNGTPQHVLAGSWLESSLYLFGWKRLTQPRLDQDHMRWRGAIFLCPFPGFSSRLVLF